MDACLLVDHLKVFENVKCLEKEMRFIAEMFHVELSKNRCFRIEVF